MDALLLYRKSPSHGEKQLINKEPFNSTPKQEASHCGSSPKRIAFGIAPLGFISIGIVPMGVVSIGVVPMGVVSLGVVAMGVINASVVGMGVLSAGLTTMGVWEWSPSSQSHVHNNKVERSNSHSNPVIPQNNLSFRTRNEAQAEARRLGCEGAHKMGNLWMPCSMHGEKY